jgi:hypothetical protein
MSMILAAGKESSRFRKPLKPWTHLRPLRCVDLYR